MGRTTKETAKTANVASNAAVSSPGAKKTAAMTAAR
jgi:hypothetical protein